MMKSVTRIVLTAAAASMVVLPVAAQANTRAGDSAAVYSVSKAKPGASRDAEGEDIVVGIPLIVAIATLGAVTVGALVAAGVVFEGTEEDEDQSPGT